jgi:hypothetical protein
LFTSHRPVTDAALPIFQIPSGYRLQVGLWPGPKWAGFGQTGLLKTGFTSNGFSLGLGNLENGLEPGITRVNILKNGHNKNRVKPGYPGFFTGENTVFISSSRDFSINNQLKAISYKFHLYFDSWF